MSSHIDAAYERDLSYADEYDDNVERDITLARTVSWIGEAGDQAAGVRSGGHLLDFAPASAVGLSTQPASGVGGGGAGSRPDSRSASGVPSSPDPVGRPHDRPAGDGGDESEAAA